MATEAASIAVETADGCFRDYKNIILNVRKYLKEIITTHSISKIYIYYQQIFYLWNFN